MLLTSLSVRVLGGVAVVSGRCSVAGRPRAGCGRSGRGRRRRGWVATTSTRRRGYAGLGRGRRPADRPARSRPRPGRSTRGVRRRRRGRRAPAPAGRRPGRRRRCEPKPSRTRSPSPRLEPGRGVVGDDPAVVDHDHPTGEGVGLLEVVGGEHDGGAASRRAGARICSWRLARFCGSRPVEGSSRNSTPRQVDQPHRDVEPAPLAAGERGDLAVGDRGRGRGRRPARRPGAARRRGTARGRGPG